jgi:hypothetical protein
MLGLQWPIGADARADPGDAGRRVHVGLGWHFVV